MKSPSEVWNFIKNHVKREWKTAFMAAFIIGLLVHMPMLLSDIPNHDGLDSMHFDQNMITSGRWFLTVACGISSYYTLPWLIGLLSLLYLGVTAALLTEFLEVKNSGAIVLIAGLLAAFPALASTFAYVFTMDGYMLALLLAVAAALAVKKHRFGFVGGGLCLAFSMGIYQAYMPFAALLSIYGILMIAMEEGSLRDKVRRGASYLWMGISGVAEYYIILRVLLLIQGKELASYQGISGMDSVVQSGNGTGLLTMIKQLYVDFVRFTVVGKALVNNGFSAICLAVLTLAVLAVLVRLCRERGWWKRIRFYVVLLFFLLAVPVAANLILLVSPEVNYHLLMRYQWALFPILMVAFVSRFGKQKSPEVWGILLGAGVLLFNFAVTDNIAYSNLQKKYEKTYAYCVRLLDRIEQTEGYYQGIPIAMIGVVSDEEYPLTDITGDVTGGMIGISGDSLLYTGSNYRLFIQNYLGATLNILPADAMAEMYYSEEYRSMDSFPGADSIRIIDGIMYVKTENIDRSEDE